MAAKIIETQIKLTGKDQTGPAFDLIAEKMKRLEQTATAVNRRMDSVARGMSRTTWASQAAFQASIVERMSGSAAATAAAAAARVGAAQRMGAAAASTIRSIRSSAGEFASYAMPGVAGSMLGMGGAALSGLAAGGAAAYGLKQAISFDKAMADVKKKINLDEGASWADVEEMINKTSRDVGMKREDMASLAAAAGQAGIAYKDLAGFMTLAAKSASAWDVGAKEAAQNLANIKTQTGWTNKELEVFADKVNALGDSTASAERDVLGMFKRSSAAAKAAGIPLDTTMAITTALNSAGMQEEVASRFTSAFASTLRTATHGTKKAKEALSEIGLTPRGVEAGMKKDATKTVLDVLDRIGKSKDQASVAVRLFGKEWWDEAARAGQVIPEIKKNLQLLAGKSWEGSLSKNLATDLATTSKHLERFGALTSEIGDRLTRWALPSINEQLDRTIKAFDTAKKTGFLAGPDGKPIDRISDKAPVPFGAANRAAFLDFGTHPAIPKGSLGAFNAYQNAFGAEEAATGLGGRIASGLDRFWGLSPQDSYSTSRSRMTGAWDALKVGGARSGALTMPLTGAYDRAAYGNSWDGSAVTAPNWSAGSGAYARVGGAQSPVGIPVAKLEGNARIENIVSVEPSDWFKVMVTQALSASGSLRGGDGLGTSMAP